MSEEPTRTFATGRVQYVQPAAGTATNNFPHMISFGAQEHQEPQYQQYYVMTEPVQADYGYVVQPSQQDYTMPLQTEIQAARRIQTFGHPATASKMERVNHTTYQPGQSAGPKMPTARIMPSSPSKMFSAGKQGSAHKYSGYFRTYQPDLKAKDAALRSISAKKLRETPNPAVSSRFAPSHR
jgi:hypothetical protein